MTTLLKGPSKRYRAKVGQPHRTAEKKYQTNAERKGLPPQPKLQDNGTLPAFLYRLSERVEQSCLCVGRFKVFVQDPPPLLALDGCDWKVNGKVELLFCRPIFFGDGYPVWCSKVNLIDDSHSGLSFL